MLTEASPKQIEQYERDWLLNDCMEHGRHVGRRRDLLQKILARCTFERAPPGSGCSGMCWLWQGPHSGNGRGGDYARMNVDGQTVAVHRVTWTNLFGYLPGKRQLDHKCKRRRCVNPWHTDNVTHKQNQRRK